MNRPAAPRAHLIGIAGAGMQALAEVLLAHGYRLSGSDVNSEAAHWLRRRGVSLDNGHDACRLYGAPRTIIYSDAVPTDNVERRMAARLRLPAPATRKSWAR